MNEDNWSNAIDPDEAPETAFESSDTESAEPAVHETVFDADGSYRIVRPQTDDRSYTDASYREAADTEIPPRYYTPDPPRAKAPKTEKKGGFMRAACLALACALLGGAVGGVIGSKTAKANTAAIQQVQSAPAETAAASAKPTSAKATASGTMTASDIYAAACQQVVGITTEVTTQNFFGQTTSAAVSGSGFIISSDGYILTNQHVISYAEAYGYDVTVMTYDGTSYTAKIVGSYASNDIAVLKIDAEGLTPVTFGDSDSITVGDTVYAVGNPLGELAYSMSTGHVSALNRTITTEDAEDIRMFQIDAAVNPGNSGGPVYDANGKVVGVVTAKYSDSGVEGLGFAIPASDAASITEDLITKGYVSGKAYMGVMLDERYNSIYAEYYNMPLGAYVYSVESGTAADRAGLEAGDIITALGERKIESYTDLRSALKDYSAGDTAEMTVYRAGESMTITITFDEVVPDKTS